MGMVAWNCMNNRILIVEDDEDIAELIRFHLQKQGYATEIAMDGKTALEQFDAARPALILLDVMLPVIDGLEVLKAIRYDRHSTVPIIIESARGEETDIVTGLELGADDYIAKPFSPTVLVAKVKSLFRRIQNDHKAPDDLVTTKRLSLDKNKHSCLADGASVDLTATEFSLLAALASEPERVFTRSQLISTTKGSDYPVTERSIDVQIATLRRKLKGCGNAIKTVWGIGYKYQED